MHFFPGITSSGRGRCEGSSWWNFRVDSKNEILWNIPWPPLNGTRSCYEGLKVDATKIRSSSVWEREGESLIGPISAEAACGWVVDWVALDFTMVDESEEIFVWEEVEIQGRRLRNEDLNF